MTEIVIIATGVGDLTIEVQGSTGQTYTIDWGDNTSSTGTLSRTMTSNINHTYIYYGKYVITIQTDTTIISKSIYYGTLKTIDDPHEQREFLLTYEIINNTYPVGAIYMNVNNVNPTTLFYGVWEQIKDKFLLGSGRLSSLGSTGGEATHTLTIDEMPSHNHSRLTHPQGFAEQNINASEILTRTSGSVKAITKNYEGYTGGGTAHNNMPPYLVVNMWRRVI